MDELRDVYQHFMLYYGPDIPKMKASIRAKKKKEREAERANREGAEGEERPPEEEEEKEEEDNLKHATRKTGYTMCVDAGLGMLTLALLIT
jgi:transcription elongation factor SPT6